MTIADLKAAIYSNTVQDRLLIFDCSDNIFLASQYIEAISKSTSKNIIYTDKVSTDSSMSFDIFNDEADSNSIQVMHTDCFDSTDIALKEVKNTIIVARKIDKDTQSIFAEYIVKLPKLENWQIKDYVYSTLKGISSANLDWLIDLCKWDIDRLDIEIHRLLLFSENERKYVFDDFVHDHVFDDLSNRTIFNFTNALLTNNKVEALNVLKELKNIDISEMGLITLLYNNFKNALRIQLSPTTSAEALGLSSKQYYAIKTNNTGYYSNQKITKIFELVTELDFMIKSGQLPMKSVIDYIVVKILGD